MSESLTKKLSDGIIDAINIICQDLPFAKIYRGKIEELLDNNYFTTNINGKSYNLPVYGDYVFSVGEIVQVVIPLNNFSTAFILPKNGSGGGGANGVQSVNGKTGVVVLTKSDFGLGNVENKNVEQILSELTASDIITALGYTPISNADIPTKLSQLENDENFITNSVNNLTNYYNKTEVDNSLSSKLNDNGDISNTIVTFTEATNRMNINSQEKTSTIFGKIKKWFSDLKTIAFTGDFSDLVSHPTTLDGYGITDGATKTELNTLSGRVDTNEDNIAMAESDIESLQTDVNTLKTDNTSIKSAVKTLQDTYVPNTRKVNNQSLDGDVILKTSDIENDSGYITQSEISSDVLMIAVTGNTADKTWDEIEAAYNNGKVIQCKSDGIIYDLAVAVIASKLLYFTSSNGYTTIHRMVYSGGSWSSGLEYLVDASRTVNGKSLATNISLTADDVGALPNQVASADNLGGIKVGAGLSITTDGILSATGGGVADAVEWNNVLDTPTTLSGYGITDANINNKTITLGQNSITPVTEIELDTKLSEKADKTNVPKIFYGTCETVADDENKVVVCPEFTADDLADNTIINIFFKYANSTTAFYLNINNTGVDYAVGQTTSVDMPVNYWRPQSILSFIYYAPRERWQILKGNVATTEYYGLTKLSSSINDTSTAMAATPSAVKQAYDLANEAKTAVDNIDLSGYLPLSGGTLTGNLTGKYITGTRLQTTQVSDKAGKFATIDNQGWIYYRTADEALADMGGAKVIKGTADLTAGTSALADGEIYLCYE